MRVFGWGLREAKGCAVWCCKSDEDTVFPTLMKVLAGGLLGPGHEGGGGGTGSGWGLPDSVPGDGGRKGSSIRSNLDSRSFGSLLLFRERIS